MRIGKLPLCVKGDSETHPVLSPDDDFPDFETWNGWAGRENGGVMWTGQRVGIRPDSLIPYEYARSALKLGLQQQAKIGANPFKFGMIGSTDSQVPVSDNFLYVAPEYPEVYPT